MKEKFYTIGYYIRKAENIPDWLGIPSEKLLSASTCLNEAHPPMDLVMSSTGWRTGSDFTADAKEYRAKYGFNEKELSDMLGDADELFDKGLLCSDSRLIIGKTAEDFYKKHYMGKGFMLIGICTTQKYIDILKEDMPIKAETPCGRPIGRDILGYDVCSFHSFLCNSLHKDNKTARFNKYCLLDNTFEETEQIAKSIEGLGEPVDWIPFVIALSDT